MGGSHIRRKTPLSRDPCGRPQGRGNKLELPLALTGGGKGEGGNRLKDSVQRAVSALSLIKKDERFDPILTPIPHDLRLRGLQERFNFVALLVALCNIECSRREIKFHVPY